MSLAENIKRLRKARGMSQGALASKAGVGQQLISQLENSVNTSTKKLPDIAKALGCQAHDLDPKYKIERDSGDDPLREKVIQLLDDGNDVQLQMLEQYLDLLLANPTHKE